jgi:hypothetical protein
MNVLLLLRMAWRNLWRHTRRTVLTALAFAAGVFLLIVFLGLGDVLGADYRFPNDVRVIGEYYFNGFGTTNPDDYLARAASPRFTRGELFNVGRQYLGLVAHWQAHPLLHLIAQGQANLLDPSALLGPAFSFSLSDEAALEAGAYFRLGEGLTAFGAPQSEFGPAPNVYYVTAKIYF